MTGTPSRPLLSSIGHALLTGAVPDGAGRSRIATCGRLFEGTDEISLGQTCSPATAAVRPTITGPWHRLLRGQHRPRSASIHASCDPLPVNVAELLAPGEKTVSFWQGRFHGSAQD